jgi:AGCS family alanine or glycine:cation symporter
MFIFIDNINNFLWGYVASFLIIFFGIYLTLFLKIYQLKKYKKIFIFFLYTLKNQNIYNNSKGIHPIKVFFTALGGCVGIGNITTTALAVQLGGPGVLIWMWIIAFCGITLKYSEIFLGLKYRIKYINKYQGGPMFFLQKAFPLYKKVSYIISFCMCLYGVEIYVFTIIRDSISINLGISRYATSSLLILIIILGISGGIQRISKISLFLIPIFISFFFIISIYIILINICKIPYALEIIAKSALNGQTAIGGFVGSTITLVVSKGISTACYSGDIGIGYTSIIYSQSKINSFKQQASLSILSIFIDTFIICTLSIGLIVVTDTWQNIINSSLLIQISLQRYFPYMDLLMPILLLILGYSTILPYMEAGIKSAVFLFPRYGFRIYFLYSLILLASFSYIESYYAFTIMNFVGGLLIFINIFGIMKLKNKLDYNL